MQDPSVEYEELSAQINAMVKEDQKVRSMNCMLYLILAT